LAFFLGPLVGGFLFPNILLIAGEHSGQKKNRKKTKRFFSHAIPLNDWLLERTDNLGFRLLGAF
jgi:hypothetical protein